MIHWRLSLGGKVIRISHSKSFIFLLATLYSLGLQYNSDSKLWSYHLKGNGLMIHQKDVCCKFFVNAIYQVKEVLLEVF